MSDSSAPTECWQLYEPINALKPVANDIWIVDGPVVRMGYAGLHLPFTTRMTVIRLPDGRLWIHSPTQPTPDLCQAIEVLGPVSFLISPNRLHTTWLPEWQRRWPDAVAAGVASQPAWDGVPLNVAIDLGGTGPFPWAMAITHVLMPGSMFSEAVFFHVPSRSLIVTDLIENFELDRVRCFWLRLLLRVTGPLHPHGTAPPDMRFSFRHQKPELRAALARIRAWRPERIILAHGKWYPVDGLRELDRAFRWIG